MGPLFVGKKNEALISPVERERGQVNAEKERNVSAWFHSQIFKLIVAEHITHGF